MPVRLRAHHILCLLTYVGRGYSLAFIANMDAAVARLAQGEPILVVAGPDEICAPLLRDEATPHCLSPGVAERDKRAAGDIGALLGRDVAPGRSLCLDEDTIAGLRDAFRRGTLRSACGGCEWASLCTAISATAFARTRLVGAPV